MTGSSRSINDFGVDRSSTASSKGEENLSHYPNHSNQSPLIDVVNRVGFVHLSII